MNITLQGQVVLVTGATGALGQAITRAAVREGATVVIHYHSATDRAQALLGEGAAWSFKCDLRDPSQARALVEGVADRFGRVDALVNNAAVRQNRLVPVMSEQDWDAVLDMNLTAPFYCGKAALAAMTRSRRGIIVNIAAMAGFRGDAGEANYSASKAGLMALTRTMALEGGPYGVRVNAVCPGFLTDGLGGTASRQAAEESRKESVLRRHSDPGSAADFICYLISERAAGVSGQIFNWDSRIEHGQIEAWGNV